MIYTSNGYYSGLNGKEILTHATMRMNLEDIMLSEISQTQKINILGLYLYEVSRVVKFIETESRMVAARGVGSLYLMDTDFQFGKTVLEMNGDMVVQQCRCI